METRKILQFSALDGAFSYRAHLFADENPEMVDRVLQSLPLESSLGHVVISGETIWFPTRIVHLGGTNMVKRTPGSVYFNAPGQSICFTCGSITESAMVNKFGQVFDEDMPILRDLGTVVWNKTIANARKELVKITMQVLS